VANKDACLLSVLGLGPIYTTATSDSIIA